MSARFAIGAASALLAAQSYAAGCGELRIDPAGIASLPTISAGAGTSGVQGIRTTVICGDPSGSGPYAIALRVPKNTQIAAHRHRDARIAVVVQGLWHFGYGETSSSDATKSLKPGSVYTEPAETAHFAYTTKQDTLVYIFGNGPTDTTYVDANHEPQKK